MPVLLAFIAEDLGFSPSRLVLEDEYVFFRWFRCLTWGGLMEVDRWLLLDQRVKEVSEVSYLFFLLCLFLPLMQRTWECVLIIWAGCRTGTGEVICYLEFAISLYIAFHRVNRQLFPGPLEKCRFKKKKVFEMLPEGKGGFNSVQSLSRVRLSVPLYYCWCHQYVIVSQASDACFISGAVNNSNFLMYSLIVHSLTFYPLVMTEKGLLIFV